MTPEEGAELTVMGGAHLTSVAEYVLKDFMEEALGKYRLAVLSECRQYSCIEVPRTGSILQN